MKNYLIIGGSSGIGRALVEQLSIENNKVFATYNTRFIESTSNVHYQKLDVLTESLDLEQLPDEIHGFAYCPGTINLKPFHRFSESDFIEDFKLQVVGAISLIQSVLPRLKQSKEASIVLFSTIAVQRGFSFHSQVSTSKGAIEGLIKSLAAEWAPTIRVNAVAPSLTKTALSDKFINSPEKEAAQAANNPLKRVGNAKEIANAAAYLLTQKSSWTTGQILHVDGGYSMIK